MPLAYFLPRWLDKLKKIAVPLVLLNINIIAIVKPAVNEPFENKIGRKFFKKEIGIIFSMNNKTRGH